MLALVLMLALESALQVSFILEYGEEDTDKSTTEDEAKPTECALLAAGELRLDKTVASVSR